MTKSDVDLRSILNLDGTDLVEASFHDVLALQHELTALALEVFLLPDCDPKLAHLLHLLSVHGCSVYLLGRPKAEEFRQICCQSPFQRQLDTVFLGQTPAKHPLTNSP